MKKFLLFIILSVSFTMMNAQNRASLHGYAGRYIFPEGSLAEDAVISIINDTTLNIAASIGECDLKYIREDTFSLPQYGGSIVFNRNEASRINGFKISIPMAGIDDLEALKEVELSFEAHGHRGNRGGQPENTIAAMISAMDIGVTTLEMDLQVSKDKKIVVSHDPYFNEKITTTPEGKFLSADEALGRLLYTMGYDSIKKYDVGLKTNPDFPGQRKIAVGKPLLSDLLQATEDHSKETKHPILYNIEIKSDPAGDRIKHPSVEEFVDLAMAVISKAKITPRTIIQSFDNRALQVMHKKYPDVKLSLLIEEDDTRSIEQMIKDLGFMPEVFSPAFQLVTQNMIEYCHSINIQVIPWTVNNEGDIIRLKNMGVDGIISDYPDRLEKIAGYRN